VDPPADSDPFAPRAMFATHRRWRFIERGQPDACDTLARKADVPRSALGKIDSAAMNVRAMIIDPDHDRSSVVEIRHPHLRSHRESTRGRGKSIFLENFAVACALAVETRSVPRSERQMTGPRRRCLRHCAQRPRPAAPSIRRRARVRATAMHISSPEASGGRRVPLARLMSHNRCQLPGVRC
jgi:hypothetical protein